MAANLIWICWRLSGISERLCTYDWPLTLLLTRSSCMLWCQTPLLPLNCRVSMQPFTVYLSPSFLGFSGKLRLTKNAFLLFEKPVLSFQLFPLHFHSSLHTHPWVSCLHYPHHPPPLTRLIGTIYTVASAFHPAFVGCCTYICTWMRSLMPLLRHLSAMLPDQNSCVLDNRWCTVVREPHSALLLSRMLLAFVLGQPRCKCTFPPSAWKFPLV